MKCYDEPGNSINLTYTYDADLPGRRGDRSIKKDVDGTVTKFVYDSLNCVAEYDGNNTLQASYITPGLDQNLTIKRSGSTYYYHQDGLGSIRNITDSSENVQNTYDYCAFGLVMGTPTENVTNDYRFTGRRYDSESGLYYYRARMYAPAYGRFTTRDPILQGNLFICGRNNPANSIDPFGLAPRRKRETDCKRTGGWRIKEEKKSKKYGSGTNLWSWIFGDRLYSTIYQCQCQLRCCLWVWEYEADLDRDPEEYNWTEGEWDYKGRVIRWRDAGHAMELWDSASDAFKAAAKLAETSIEVAWSWSDPEAEAPKIIGHEIGKAFEELIEDPEAVQIWQNKHNKKLKDYKDACEDSCSAE